MQFTAIIPAAGSGSRFGGTTPKQFLPLRNKSILAHTVSRLLAAGDDVRVVIAVSPAWVTKTREIVEGEGWAGVEIIHGGSTRQASVSRALESIAASSPEDIVAVHDSVRPFVSNRLIERLVLAAEQIGASCPVLAVTDTVHRNDGSKITGLVDRAELALAQTPQCFRVGTLRSVLEIASRDVVTGTDDAGLAARYGFEVRIVPGELQNLKITTSADLDLAEAMFDVWSPLCSA